MATRRENLRLTLGVLAVVLIAAAAAGAAWVAWGLSVWLLAGYLAASAAGGGVILWAFCAKCPCADHGCGHVFPGPLARMILPRRTPGPYRAAELGATGLALAVVLLAPQAWLWQSVPVLVGFWVLVIAALGMIRASVCRGCGNEFCPGNPVS